MHLDNQEIDNSRDVLFRDFAVHRVVNRFDNCRFVCDVDFAHDFLLNPSLP